MSRVVKTTSARLRHRLTLQQEIKTPDGAGGYTSSWQDIVNLWAEINPVTGKEKLFASQLQAEVSHKITIRYRLGISAGMRFLYGSRVFNIHAILNPKESYEILEIWAGELG